MGLKQYLKWAYVVNCPFTSIAPIVGLAIHELNYFSEKPDFTTAIISTCIVANGLLLSLINSSYYKGIKKDFESTKLSLPDYIRKDKPTSNIRKRMFRALGIELDLEAKVNIVLEELSS